MWFAPSLRSGSSGKSLLSVQVLRAAAATSVAIHHAGYDADTIATHVGIPQLGLDRFFDWGFGVHLFFVISGFIMVRTAKGFGEPGASRWFMLRRVLRVVPLYWLMTSLVLVGAMLAPTLLNVPVDGWALFLGSYLFIPVARINGEIRPILGQGWTLNYEMFFYLLFAHAMLLPRRFGLPVLAGALIGLVVLGDLLSPAWPPAAVWTDGLLIEFILGGMIGLAVESGLRLGGFAMAAIVLLGVLTTIWLGPLHPQFDGLAPWLREGLPAGAIVAGCVLGPAWPRWSGVLLIGAVGDASYSLYLTHPFTIRVLRTVWAVTLGPFLPVSIFLVLSCGAAVGVALLVFRWIENPMTLYLHRRFPESASVHRQPSTADGIGSVG